MAGETGAVGAGVVLRRSLHDAPRGHVHTPAACYRPWAVTSIGAEDWHGDAMQFMCCNVKLDAARLFCMG